MKRGCKAGQMKMSFGMIFSIILIIIFLVFAFYGIKFFIDMQEKAKIGTFVENFQKKINGLWEGPEGSTEFTASLPKKIERVCLKNWEYENLVFIPSSAVELGPFNIKHIDIEKTTSGNNGGRNNELCFENSGDEISMILKKNYGETLVTISKV